jgi:hypothetical protein
MLSTRSLATSMLPPGRGLQLQDLSIGKNLEATMIRELRNR